VFIGEVGTHTIGAEVKDSFGGSAELENATALTVTTNTAASIGSACGLISAAEVSFYCNLTS
jgi:hypothetical protein